MRRVLFVTVAAIGVLVAGEAVRAAAVYGDAATLTGSRDTTTGGGLTHDGNWDDANSGEQGISWSITLSGGTYTYSYTLTGFENPELSHLTLDLTDDALDEDQLADPDAVKNVSVSHNGYELDFKETTFSSDPGITGAVKFDGLQSGSGAYTLSFESNRNPVWGQISAKGGSNTYVRNIAYGDMTDSNTQHYVARPNGVVPEPTSLSLLGLGGLVMFRRRRKAGRGAT